MTLNTHSIPHASLICLICVVVGSSTADYRIIPNLAVPPQQPDVPACHVHGQTLRYHEPPSNATPKTWDDALRVPLAVWAGDCLSASDDHVRQAGEALTRRRVDSATCCCASWNAQAVAPPETPRSSCNATFGTEQLKRPPASGCDSAVLMSGRLFQGYFTAFSAALASAVRFLLPNMPNACIFVAMTCDTADHDKVVELLEETPAVVAYIVEPTASFMQIAEAIEHCTDGSFDDFFAELSRRHKPRQPMKTTADMYRHIYLTDYLIDRYELFAKRYLGVKTFVVKYMSRVRIDHFYASAPFTWETVQRLMQKPSNLPRPHGSILIGSASASKVAKKQRVGVPSEFRCITYDTFAIGPRILMKRYLRLYVDFKREIPLHAIYRRDFDGMESEHIIAAHLRMNHVPWEDMTFSAQLYFGPYGCTNLHRPQDKVFSSPVACEHTKQPPQLNTNNPGRLCDETGCADLRSRLEYFPSELFTARTKAVADRTRIPRMLLLAAIDELQFPGNEVHSKVCAAAKIGGIYNAGLAATFHGLVAQFKRSLRDGTNLVLSLGTYKLHPPQTAKQYLPRDRRTFLYGMCASGSLECIFEPHSSCVLEVAQSTSNISWPVDQLAVDKAQRFVYASRLPDDSPNWVPHEFSALSPFEFIATIAGAQWRLQSNVVQAVVARRAALKNLPLNEPYVGVHIRRGDSCGKGFGNIEQVHNGKRQCWTVDTYAVHVERMAKQYDLRHVFVASDDAHAASDLQRLLPSLEVSAFNAAISQESGNTRRIELRLAALGRLDWRLRMLTIEVLADVEMLANSTALVGGFHSQVFRLAFELSYFRKDGHIIPFKSIDISWCYGGSWGKDNVTAVNRTMSVEVAC